ncbi:hypothetical protein PRIPAC_94561 [Pristionchus pacificus]|uniref:Uncharacterized protein n=1 Tax=Pristionchus pacificus TaxID=54126 RepID=A0A2A6CHR6_PRIPA|nr:hypothetical protein PRIPAC_94561 [Pristionchus pacificus]|eukprot:PDM77603.1 hypothetical protein PRIPAC_34470 [Pristionchus pacificus]
MIFDLSTRLLLPPPAAAAAAAAAATILLVATVIVSCAGKKKEPKLLDIADDQSIADSSTLSKPSSNSSNGSDQSLKPRKDKTVDDISKRWKEGNQIFTEMDESDAEQDPKLIVPKTERSAKKAKDKKKLLFPPAKLVVPPPAAAADKKRPTLAALQPPSSDPESDTSAGPDKPMTTPAPDDGAYQCLDGLDDSKKKKTTVRRVSRIVRPAAAHESLAPRGRTPMCQPSPVGTPAAALAKDQSTPHAARRVPPAAAAAPAKPVAARPIVEVDDGAPVPKTAHTDVSLLADRIAPQEQTPVAPSPAPRAIKCAPMPAQPAAVAPVVIASAPGTPVRAAPRTPAAAPLCLPPPVAATSPACKNMKSNQEKTQPDSSPHRGKVVC